jgi:hypothetical protein
MAKKKTIDELANEIIRDFDAGDTPAARARAALQQARDAGDGGLRYEHLRAAQRHIASIDPAKHPKALQRLQAEALALQGRGGDTKIAHLTPGEMVIPRSLITPELLNMLAAVARQHGVDPREFFVGSGRNAVNPHTGQMEFDDSDISDLPPLESLKDFQPNLENPVPFTGADQQALEDDHDLHRVAGAIYGETGGLVPQLLNPHGNPLNSNNWDPASAKQLHDARAQLGAMYSKSIPAWFQNPFLQTYRGLEQSRVNLPWQRLGTPAISLWIRV